MDFEEELLYFKAVSSPKLPLVKLQLMLEKCLGAMHSQICCGPGDSGSQTCRRQAPPRLAGTRSPCLMVIQDPEAQS